MNNRDITHSMSLSIMQEVPLFNVRPTFVPMNVIDDMSSSFSAVHHPLLDSPILFHSCLSWAVCLRSTRTHSSQFISPSSTGSTLLLIHILSDTIPVLLASICHPFFSLCVPYPYCYICHFGHTSYPCTSFAISSCYAKHASFHASMCALFLS
jgi:hypothetical protein